MMFCPKTLALAALVSSVSVDAFMTPRTLLTPSIAHATLFNQSAPVHSAFDNSLKLTGGASADVSTTEGEKGGPLSAITSFLAMVLKTILTPIQKLLVALKSGLVGLVGYAFEMYTGGILTPQTQPFPYGSPLAGDDSLSSDVTSLAIQERSTFIFESFDVQGINGPFCAIKGIKLLISGKDTIRFYTDGKRVATVKKNRKTPYNIFRANGEKIGWVERANVDYEVYAEPEATESEPAESEPAESEPTEPVKPKLAYKLSGDFLNRRFTMTTDKNKVVAKVTKRVIAFPFFDHYNIRIAPGMDPYLVLACMTVIDEEYDEKLKDKAEELAKKSSKKLISLINPFD